MAGASSNRLGPTPGSHHLDRRADKIAAEGAGDLDDLLDTKAMSAWFGYSEQWFEIGRSKGYGPPFIRVGPQRIRYRRSDALAYLAERTHASTAEYATAGVKQRERGRRSRPTGSHSESPEPSAKPGR